MKEIMMVFREGLVDGLRKSVRNPRNKQALIQSVGAFPEDNVVRALEDFRPYQLDTVSLGEMEHPFPQIFVLSQTIVVCSKTSIYEWKAGNFETKLVDITPGSTWTVADYGQYLIMTNGNVLVIKDPETHEYISYLDCDVPQCLCLCDVNGQLLIGAPGVSVSDGFYS